MELERKVNNKFSDVSPMCIKDKNMNNVNIYDTSFKSKKVFDDGFKTITKLKRNFK